MSQTITITVNRKQDNKNEENFALGLLIQLTGGLMMCLSMCIGGFSHNYFLAQVVLGLGIIFALSGGVVVSYAIIKS